MIYIIKIGIYNKNIIKIYNIYIYMNYKNKYLKYKIKYIFLKKKLGGMYTPPQQPSKILYNYTNYKDIFGIVYNLIQEQFSNLVSTFDQIKDKLIGNKDDLKKILDECNNKEKTQLDKEETIRETIQPYFDESDSDTTQSSLSDIYSLDDIDDEVAENQDPEIYPLEIEINEEDENQNQPPELPTMELEINEEDENHNQ